MGRWATVTEIMVNGWKKTSVVIYSAQGTHIASKRYRGWDVDLAAVLSGWKVEEVYR